MQRFFVTLAGVFGALGVGLGAFAAHGLRSKLPESMLSVFHTGVLYHLIHAAALLGVAALLGRGQGKALVWSGGLFVAGIVLFSGSLYALALTGTRALGLITPLGGLCFVAGWIGLVVAARRVGSSDQP